MLSFMFEFFKRKKTTEVEYPYIARYRVVSILCPTCGKQLKHNDLTVWHEKESGWRSELHHAECVVFIRYSDLSVRTLNGNLVRTDGRGGILDPLPKGAVLLTEAEWETWKSFSDEVEKKDTSRS